MGLSKVNLIILFLKLAYNPLKSQNFIVYIHYLRKFHQVAEFHHQKNNVRDNLLADICNASQGQK
jgi:hypothetical protein